MAHAQKGRFAMTSNRSTLWNLLRRSGRLMMLAQVTRATGVAFAVFLGAILTAIILDAVFALRPVWLMIVDAALLIIAAFATAYIARQVYRNSFNARHVARLIEERVGIRDSRLINAVDLDAQRKRRSTAPHFVERSIEGGEALAGTLSPRVVVDALSLRRTAIVAGVVGLLAITFYVAIPGMFGAVSRRYLNPTALHPPFTLLTFDVKIDPNEIYYGRPAEIRATINGPGVPDRAEVVFIDAPIGAAVSTRAQSNSTVPMLRSVAGEGGEAKSGERVFVLPIDRAEKSRDFYVNTDAGRSELFTLSVLPVPLFEHVSVEYKFPEYTKWPPATRMLDAEGVKALVGTEVVLTATSNLPLSAGAIIVNSTGDELQTAAQRIKMEPLPSDPATVRGAFVIQRDGHFDVSLIGIDGTSSNEHRDGAIVAVPDRTPAVEITHPAEHVVVLEDYPVQVAIRARDDVGISRITLNRSINGYGPTATDVPLQGGDRLMNAAAEYEFDLAALGARGGDVITYFATAYDNHPDPAQFADTRTFVIEVITKQEYEEYARSEYRMEEIMQEQQAFNRRLEELKAQREDLLKQIEPLKQRAQSSEELSAEELKQMRELQEQLNRYSQRTEDLARDVQTRAEQQSLYEFEQPYNELLKSLAEQLKKQSQNANDVTQTMDAVQDAQQEEPSSDSSAAACKSMAGACQKFQNESQPFDEQSQGQMQQAQTDMEAMQLADEMTAQAERIREAILQQRDLADRLAQMKDAEELSPSEQLRAHRLADEQERLREELRDAREKLKQAAEEAQERLPRMSRQAKSLCEKIGEMNVEKDQDHAAESAREGEPRQAHQAANHAAENLETLLSECNSEQMQQQASDELDGCLKLPKPGMRNSMKQMAQSRRIPGLGKQQNQGSGFNGSQPRMMVMGPHMQRAKAAQGKSDAPPRMTQVQVSANGGTGVGSRESSDAASAESLTPESASGRQAVAAALAGVPIPYRDQAEAYFKRLAKDARKNDVKER
jgi:hypothetical protein